MSTKKKQIMPGYELNKFQEFKDNWKYPFVKDDLKNNSRNPAWKVMAAHTQIIRNI